MRYHGGYFIVCLHPLQIKEEVFSLTSIPASLSFLINSSLSVKSCNFCLFKFSSFFSKSSLSQSAETKKEVTKVKTPQQNLQIKKEIQKIETQISVLEKEKSELELAFLNPGLSPEEMTKLSIKLAKVTDEIDEKTMIWMEYSDEMGQ